MKDYEVEFRGDQVQMTRERYAALLECEEADNKARRDIPLYNRDRDDAELTKEAVERADRLRSLKSSFDGLAYHAFIGGFKAGFRAYSDALRFESEEELAVEGYFADPDPVCMRPDIWALAWMIGARYAPEFNALHQGQLDEMGEIPPGAGPMAYGGWE